MRTSATLIALFGLVALPGGTRAEDTEPAADEARLQELERILAETAPEPESEAEPESEPEPEPEPEPEAEADSDAEPAAKPKPELGSESAPGPKPDPAPVDCGPAVTFRRGGVPDPVTVQLTDCSGQPSAEALAALSALAQPPVPALAEAPAHDEAAQQLNPGLLVRLQRIAQRFPGRAIDVVSGLRPRARPGSRHRSGDALDIRIEGVDDAELAELARTFEGTGVGFYPNSTFVHIDVRAEPAYWVDRSRPGQPPDYRPAPAASEQPATETVEQPATETVEPPASETAPVDPELQALSDRALLVMKLARPAPTGMAEPEAPDQLL